MIKIRIVIIHGAKYFENLKEFKMAKIVISVTSQETNKIMVKKAVG